jgi:hypothetical protein
VYVHVPEARDQVAAAAVDDLRSKGDAHSCARPNRQNAVIHDQDRLLGEYPPVLDVYHIRMREGETDRAGR